MCGCRRQSGETSFKFGTVNCDLPCGCTRLLNTVRCRCAMADGRGVELEALSGLRTTWYEVRPIRDDLQARAFAVRQRV